LAPHAYSISLIQSVSSKTWDNRNPRGSTQSQALQKSVPAHIYTKFERARACHANGLENMPLFVAAVILGNFAALESAELNMACGVYLGLRALYTVAYIVIERKRYSFFRTAVWTAGMIDCMWVVVKAGSVVAKKSMD